MDIWTIILYAVGVLFNIGAVSAVRVAAVDKGKVFLASGRVAVALVFVLCFLELLVTGKFEAFGDAQAFVTLLQTASTMTVAALGTHSTYKTVTDR